LIGEEEICNQVSSQIRVHVLLSLDSLEVLLLDEDIDALFDEGDLGLEARLELLDDFGDEGSMLELFSGLHDTDDGGLHEEFSLLDDLLLGDLLSRLFSRGASATSSFSSSSLERDVDVELDFSLGWLELLVEEELMIRRDGIFLGVFHFGRGRQDASLEQGSDDGDQSLIGDLGSRQEISQREFGGGGS